MKDTGEHLAELRQAHDLCVSAFPKDKNAYVYWATVKDVRSLKGSHGKVAPDAFHGVPDDTFAAWCWYGNGPQRWKAYAVTDGQQPLFVGEETSQYPPVGSPTKVA